jgi:class 3 adenylate cyclase
MEIKQAVIVLADISGYTKFVTLHAMSLLHAEKIVTELLESILDATSEPLIVNKLEGDAVLLYAEVGEKGAETARKVLSQVVSFFEAFTARSKELTGCSNLCPCDACRQADQLRLKTIIHCGEIAVKKVRDFEEVAGSSVILAHRLVKNSIDAREYILVTKPFVELSDGLKNLETEGRTEDCEDIGEVAVEVHYPNDGSRGGSLDLPQRREVVRSLANAVRLDGYGFARTLGLRKAPSRLQGDSEDRPGFWKFSSDGLRGLWMLFRGE